MNVLLIFFEIFGLSLSLSVALWTLSICLYLSSSSFDWFSLGKKEIPSFSLFIWDSFLHDLV